MSLLLTPPATSFARRRSILTDNLTIRTALHKKLMICGFLYMLGWGLFCSLAVPLLSFLNVGGLILYFTVTFGHVYISKFRTQDSSYVLLLLCMMSTHLFVQGEPHTTALARS